LYYLRHGLLLEILSLHLTTMEELWPLGMSRIKTECRRTELRLLLLLLLLLP
jgi:hypothetical protein